MPIYEFKCTDCGEYTELLLMNKEKNIELKCGNCTSKNLERIVSSTNYSMSVASRNNDRNCSASTKSRTCSGGSCTTYNIPGQS